MASADREIGGRSSRHIIHAKYLLRYGTGEVLQVGFQIQYIHKSTMY